MSWSIVFSVFVLGLIVFPGLVFLGHLRRIAKAKADA